MSDKSALQNLLKNDNFIWFVSASLSLSVFVVLFILHQQKLNAAPAVVIQETITHVKFSNIAPPPVAIVEPEIKEPEPEKKKIEEVIEPEPVQEEPKPIVKAKPKPKPKKKKKPETKVKPKPPLKKAKPKPVKKKQKASEPVKPVTSKQAKPSPVVSKADLLLIEQTRVSYHSLLMHHIDVHKHYPRAARKRKIQGKILVSFTLLKGGKIKNLSVNGKRSILKKASHQAVNNALPMPSPPNSLSLPMKVEFYMNYFLK